VRALSELLLSIIYCLTRKKSVFYKFLNYFVIKVSEIKIKWDPTRCSLGKAAGKTKGIREWIG